MTKKRFLPGILAIVFCVTALFLTGCGGAASAVVTALIGSNPNLAIPLTEGKFENGIISSIDTGGDWPGRWFKFTATAETQYIHIKFPTPEPDKTTLDAVRIQLKSGTPDAGLTAEGETETLYSYTTPHKLFISRTVTVGKEYYINITAYGSKYGDYQIAFSKTQAVPSPAIEVPADNVTTLTFNAWTSGNITVKDGEQWFKFIATNAAYYLHFNPDTISSNSMFVGTVQLYDNEGYTVDNGILIGASSFREVVTIGKTYYLKIKAFSTEDADYKGAYAIGLTASSTPPAITLPTTGVTTLTAGIWGDGNIRGMSEQWFKFTANAATQYIQFEAGALSALIARLYDSSGNVIGEPISLSDSILFGDNRSVSRTVTSGSEYYIRAWGILGAGGTYKIGFTASNTPPAIALPSANVTQLTADTWTDGTIAKGGEQWFKFTATASAAAQFIHFKPGTLDDVYVRLYDSTGTLVGDRTQLRNSTTLITSRTVTSGSEYYIRVIPASSSSGGAYKIGVTSTFTPPGVTVTQLTTEKKWSDGKLENRDDEQWFKFTATASTQYIHFKRDTLNSVYLQLYDDSGATVGYKESPNTTTRYISRTVTSGKDYYIKVTTYDISGDGWDSGTYKIAFSASGTTPVPNAEDITTLIEDKYADGSLASNSSEEWFGFTATADTQYIHFLRGNIPGIKVQLYDSAGATVGEPKTLTTDSPNALNTSVTVTNGSTYYIKVTLDYAMVSAPFTYQIGFNTGATPPPITLPTEGVTELTNVDTFASGSLASSSAEQWFKFTATAATQYIIFKPGTGTGALTVVNVQLYDNNGRTVGDKTSLSYNNSPLSRPVTSSETYYIKVTTGSSGAYQIGFSATFPGTASATEITPANNWTSGNIATAGGEQWFKFTATANTQYIHFKPGTGTGAITYVYVQLYDSTGANVGDPTYLYGSTLSTSRPVTNGSLYYIKVTSTSSTATGAYQIGFNTSTTAPTTP